MKKAVVILLAIMLVCGLCACAQPEANPGQGTAPGTEGTEPGMDEPGGSPETPVLTGADGADDTKNNTEDGKTPDAASETLTGKIAEVKDGVIVLANEKLGLLTASLKDASLYGLDGGEITPEALRAGMEIELTYNGMIMETYPGQPAGVSSLTVTSEGGDLIGLYCNVFADLYEVDAGLNDGIEMLAFDLTKVTNLTDSEKEALVYLLGCRYGMTVLTGTYQELCDAGYIDAESLSFEDGLLITIEVTEEGDGAFTFNAEKWRSGDGAYFFADCEASLQNGSWTYTVGEEMIS